LLWSRVMLSDRHAEAVATTWYEHTKMQVQASYTEIYAPAWF
jgi:hypothetical protein